MRTMCLAASVLLSVATAACAMQTSPTPPPPEPGEPRVTATFAGGRLIMRDADDGGILIDNRDFPPYQKFSPGALEPVITMHPQPTGFDLLYTFTNTLAEPRPLGMMDIGVITLGQHVEWFDFRGPTKTFEADHQNYAIQAWGYPDDLYSPVAVLRNDRYVVGVSLQYPMLEWKHDTVVMLGTPRGSYASGEGGQGWNVGFQVGNAPGQTLLTGSAMLDPGERRTYVVSVRVSEDPQDWMRTLLPYRDYFHATYGGVQYTRDPSPVNAASLAQTTRLSPQNPYGYDQLQRRPDIHGWGPLTESLRNDFASAGRLMIWAPTGLNLNHDELNYPFRFASNLYSSPQLATAFDASIGLPSLQTVGIELGLWWGFSLRYTPAWDTPPAEDLDFRNPAHLEAALREFDAAVAAGTTTIGLDSFVHHCMPVWDQLEWIEMLKARAPQMRFVGEPSVSDVMHRVIATFHSSWTYDPNPATVEDLTIINNPDYLADFLLPGHESWSGMTWHLWRQHFHHLPNNQRVREDINRMAAFGYVPCIFWDRLSGTNPAAASWLSTVPPGLQLQPQPVTTPPPEPPPAPVGGGGSANHGPGVPGVGGGGGGHIPPTIGGGPGSGSGSGSTTGSGSTGGVVGYTGSPTGGGSGPASGGSVNGGLADGGGSGSGGGGGGGGGAVGGGGGGGGGGGISMSTGGGAAPSTGTGVATTTNPNGFRRTRTQFTKAEIEAAIARAKADMLAFKPTASADDNKQPVEEPAKP